MVRICIYVFVCLSLASSLLAQDTSRPQTIQVTSSFKPSLVPAAKILFNATPPPPADIRKGLSYDIPQPQWMPLLQPVTLKPIALQIDTFNTRLKHNYFSLGAGNFRGLSSDALITFLQNDHSRLQLKANTISQRGPIPLQQYRNSAVSLDGSTQLKQLTLYGKLGYRNDQYFLYAPDPSNASLPKDSMSRNFSDIHVNGGISNGRIEKVDIRYLPSFDLHFFSDQLGNAETNAAIDLPVEKKIMRQFTLMVHGKADFTHFRSANNATFNNHLYWINTALGIDQPNLKGKLGIQPTWNNGTMMLLPDMQFDVPLRSASTTLTFGWVAHLRKNNYQWVIAQNPFASPPATPFNTRTSQAFIGLKGKIINKVNYRITSGYTQMNDAALFVNNTLRPSRFDMVREAYINAIHTFGEISYVQQEKFDVRATAELYRFLQVRTYDKAFHMLPFRFQSHVRWYPINAMVVKADFFIWRGPQVLALPNTVARLGNAYDVNIALEYKTSSVLTLWLQGNNLLNNRYQRWNGYEVLGLNVLGGIRLTFDQKQ
ncbi:MAG: hypothetical protein ACO3BD_05255 [Chitinophagaceae bacterium]